MKPQLTKEAFAEWCEKQQADKHYDLYRRMDCALAQYAQSLGFRGATAGFEIETEEGKSRPLAGLDSWDAHDVLADGPRTFGALARRLRA